MDVRVEEKANHSATQTRAQKAPPCTLVIFGAGGDLTKRLLMPAIYNLSKAKLLSEKFAIIAVDRTPKPVEAFRDYLAEGIRSFVSDTASGPATEPFDKEAWEFVASRITHFAGDLTQSDTYARLYGAVEKTGGNAIFYLAVASQLFGTIVEHIGAVGLTEEKDGCFRRVIIEKPFGTDLASARALNARILKVLSESQIYRMDHFLGKETVQNIMVLRFANGVFEPIWNRDHIDHVQITVAETVGVELRARFYEATGALRDMVPNHVFQLLSLTAMEPPNSFDADAVRTEKHKVLEAVHPLDDAEVRRNPVSPATAEPRPTSRCGSVSIIGAGRGCRFTCAPANGLRGARPKSRFNSSRRRSRCSAIPLSTPCRPTFLLSSCNPTRVHRCNSAQRFRARR